MINQSCKEPLNLTNDDIALIDDYLNDPGYIYAARQNKKLLFPFNILLDLLYNLVCKVLIYKFADKKPEPAPCDLLFYATPQMLARARPLLKNLEDRHGLKIRVILQAAPYQFLRSGKGYCSKKQKVTPYILAELFINYLLEKYRPKVVLTMMNNAYESVIFKRKVRGEAKVINLSHCITLKHHFLLAFDYYFLFGQGSADNIRSHERSYGTCKAILAGPIKKQKRYELSAKKEENSVLLFSQVMTTWFYENLTPRNESGQQLLFFQEAVTKWIAASPHIKLYIRLHPHEITNTWKDLIERFDNVVLSDSKLPMHEALEGIQVCMTCFSSAAVDAAVLGVPSVFVNQGNFHEPLLHTNQFFMPAAESKEGINAQLDKIVNNYGLYRKKARTLADYHYRDPENTIENHARHILDIMAGKDLEDVILLGGEE